MQWQVSLGSEDIDGCLVCSEQGMDTQVLVEEVLQQFVQVANFKYLENNALLITTYQ